MSEPKKFERPSDEEIKAQRLAKQQAKEARKNAALNKQAQQQAAVKDKTEKKEKEKPEKKDKKPQNADNAKPMSPQFRQHQQQPPQQSPLMLPENKPADISPPFGPLSSSSAAPKQGAAATKRAAVAQFDNPKERAKLAKSQKVARTEVAKQVPMFSHLPQYVRETSLSAKIGFSAHDVHPAIVRLGMQLVAGTLTGTNARVCALIDALRQFVEDYETPPSKVFSHDMLRQIRPLFRFLSDCRPLGIGMGNTIKTFKARISQIPETWTQDQAKAYLLEQLQSYLTERIELADDVIVSHGLSRITDGDVVLTYATSAVVEQILMKAFDENIKFEVIVVDSRPKYEGRLLLERLVAHGLTCSYTLIHSLSHVMKRATKVFLGAAAALANGSVISRVGSSLVGLSAKTFNVPVLVCCEMYKFGERVQLDSITWNELGDPEELVTINNGEETRTSPFLANWRELPQLNMLNLVYDCLPAEFVSMVITENGMIPPSSVPVIIREYHKEETTDSSERF